MNIKSPFPGLDPYLEMHWGDVHHRLTMYSCDVLQPELPDDLLARVEERVYVEREDQRGRSFAPDTRIVEWRPGGGGETGGGTAVLEAGDIAVAEPRFFLEEAAETTEGYIEIREGDGGRVVTVIEFLSPGNKLGREGRRLYLSKQRQILASDASLVEIDLVRAGRRVLAIRETSIPHEWRHGLLACIRRGWKPDVRELYGFSLRERLPALAIPLRASEAPVRLDLQALLDQCYRNGRYDRLDYSRAPEPRLRRDDAAWAEEMLTAAGKRPPTAS